MSEWPSRAEAMQVGDYMSMRGDTFNSWYAGREAQSIPVAPEEMVTVRIVDIQEKTPEDLIKYHYRLDVLKCYKIDAVVIEAVNATGMQVRKIVHPSLWYNRGIPHHN